MMSRRSGPSLAFAVSAAVHGGLLGYGAAILDDASALGIRLAGRPPPAVEVAVDVAEIELPRANATSAGETTTVVDDTPIRLAGARIALPDTGDAGRGGRGGPRALALADAVAGLTLSADAANHDDFDQIQRIETAGERRTYDDRRATPNPAELTFLASGKGERFERRDPARSEPSRGLSAGGAFRPEGASPPGIGLTGAGVPGSVRPVPPAGVRDGAPGTAYRRSAAVAYARPAVRRGQASIPSRERGRPHDTVDSTQSIASTVQSLVSASTRGGLLRDDAGGMGDPSKPPAAFGMTGSGNGGRPMGPGAENGDVVVGGALHYAESVAKKVYPYWRDAFPMWAQLEGRSGVAVIGVTIHADGTVSGLQVVRRSGVAEFDINVARALERAAPFAPLPEKLRGTGLRLHIAFDALNPTVGRLGPGPGRR